jgi:hypothetical protein
VGQATRSKISTENTETAGNTDIFQLFPAHSEALSVSVFYQAQATKNDPTAG